MSEEPKNKLPKKNKLQKPRDPKLQKQDHGYANEFDLWNLDEETPKPKTVDAVTEVVPVDLRLVDESESKRLPEGSLVKKEDRVSESISSSSLVPNQTVQRKGEDSVWQDFLEDEQITQSTEVLAEKMADENPQRLPEKPAAKTKDESKTIEKTIAKSDEVKAKKSSTNLEEELASAPSETSKGDVTDAPVIQIAKFSRLEKITSIILLVALAIVGLIAAKLVKDNLKTNRDAITTPDYPVKGAIASIAGGETFWRKPITTGENPESTQPEIKIIPIVNITLGSCASSTGAIRIYFRTDKKQQTGDTVTKEFKDGKFVANQSQTLSFVCTSGFKEYGDLEAYRANVSEPWYAEVYEAASLDTEVSGYKLLCKIPISKERK